MIRIDHSRDRIHGESSCETRSEVLLRVSRLDSFWRPAMSDRVFGVRVLVGVGSHRARCGGVCVQSGLPLLCGNSCSISVNFSGGGAYENALSGRCLISK